MLEPLKSNFPHQHQVLRLTFLCHLLHVSFLFSRYNYHGLDDAVDGDGDDGNEGGGDGRRRKGKKMPNSAPDSFDEPSPPNVSKPRGKCHSTFLFSLMYSLRESSNTIIGKKQRFYLTLRGEILSPSKSQHCWKYQ